MARNKKEKEPKVIKYVRCTADGDPEMIKGHIYEVLEITETGYDIVNESGLDYWYPRSCFQNVQFLKKVVCIQSPSKNLVEGKIYYVFKEYGDMYDVIDETEYDNWYGKVFFEDIK